MYKVSPSPGSSLTLNSIFDYYTGTPKPSTPSPDASALSLPPYTYRDTHASRYTQPSPADLAKEEAAWWNDPSNVHNPFNWPDLKKWRTTILASFMTFVIQINGTMMTSAAEQINHSFHVSDEYFPHSYWPVLAWNLGGAAAPMVGIPRYESLDYKEVGQGIY